SGLTALCGDGRPDLEPDPRGSVLAAPIGVLYGCIFHQRYGRPAMLFSRKTAAMPSAETALKGRAEPIATAATHFITGRPLKGPYPSGYETALFGLGCFWGAERMFWQTEGVWVTAVGYAGGLTPNPTYEEVCSGRTGHNEVVLVVFDPAKVSYEALLKVFWEGHDPTQGMRQGNDVGTQYRSGIYVASAAQRRAAEVSKA